MKFLAYSDPHFHNHLSGAVALEGGMNSRLRDIAAAVRQVYKIARERKIDSVLFGGDLFTSKSSVQVVAFNEAFKIITEENKDIETIMIPGNHDMATGDGLVDALYPFQNGGESTVVISEPKVISFPSVALGCLPYPMVNGKFNKEKFDHGSAFIKTEIERLFPDKYKILLSHAYTHQLMQKHLGIDGDIDCKEVIDFFDVTLLGHHHVHDTFQDPKTGHVVVSIGSPLQLNFGDRGTYHGCVLIDTEERIFEFIPIKSPRFFSLGGMKEIDPAAIKDGIVRIKAKDSGEAAAIETALMEAGAAFWVIEKIPDTPETRIDVSEDAKDKDILAAYVGSDWGATDLETPKLLSLGLEFLGGTS